MLTGTQTACENISQPIFIIKAGSAKKNMVIDTGNADTKLAIKKMVSSSIMIWIPLTIAGATWLIIEVLLSTCDIAYGR